VTEPNHTIVLEAASTQLIEVQRALSEHGIRAEIVKPPGAKHNA
jgi:hypothetical protein